MELRHLRYFRAVAEERNFSRAAERLHIAQPPLSQQIRHLEAELRVALLDRRTRPLQLTEAGRFFLDQTLRLLSQVDEMVGGARRIGSGGGGWLDVGFVGSAMYSAFPRVVRAFREHHPDVELRLHEMTTLEQAEALKHRRIHIGIGRLTIVDPEIEQEILLEEPLVIALPAGHPFTRKRRRLAVADLVGESFVLYPSSPRPSYADYVIGLCRDVGFIPRVAQQTIQLETALGLVAAGLGITIVPDSVRGHKRVGVHYILLQTPEPTSPIIMNVRRDERSTVLDAFRAIVHSGLFKQQRRSGA